MLQLASLTVGKAKLASLTVGGVDMTGMMEINAPLMSIKLRIVVSLGQFDQKSVYDGKCLQQEENQMHEKETIKSLNKLK